MKATTKGNFDAVVGISNDNLNNLSKEVYNSLYPKLFTGTINVNKPLLKTVQYNFKEAVVIDLTDNAQARKLAMQDANVSFKDDEEQLATFADFIKNNMVAFSIKANSFEIKADGQTFTGSVGADSIASIDTKGEVVFKLLKVKVTLPGHDIIGGLLNGFIAGNLDSLNKTLEGNPIALPSSFAGANFCPPAFKLEGNTLFSYLSLDSNGATVAGTITRDFRQFIAFDEKLASLIANNKLEKKDNRRGRVKFSKKVGICHFSADANYSVGVRNVRTTFGKGKNVTVNLDAFGSGKAKVELCGVGPSVGLSITAKPVVTSALNIENDQVSINLDKINDFSVDISVLHFPKFLDKFLSFLISGLTAPLRILINQAIRQFPTIPIATVHPIPLTLANTPLEIGLNLSSLNNDNLSPDKILRSVLVDFSVTKAAGKEDAVLETPELVMA